MCIAVALLCRENNFPIDSLAKYKLQSNICSYQDLATIQAVKDIMAGHIPDFLADEKRLSLLGLCEQ